MVDVGAMETANDAALQNRISRFVIKEFLWDCMPQPKETLVKLRERPFKALDDMYRNIDSKISLGIYGDTVSWERRHLAPIAQTPLKFLDSRLPLAATINAVLRTSISHEPMVFADGSVVLDDEDDSFDREVAAVEFFESVLLSRDNSFSLQYEIQKLFSYVKYCNESGVIIALLKLISLIRFNAETVLATEKSNGVSILLNLLSSEASSVKRAALIILKKLCCLLYFGKIVVGLGGIETLTDLLLTETETVNCLAVELLSSLAFLRETRIIAFRNNLITGVVSLLGKVLPEFRLYELGRQRGPLRGLGASNHDNIICAITCSLHTLGRLGYFRPNIALMREAGLIPLLIDCLTFKKHEILDATYQVLAVCVTDEVVRKSFLDRNLVRNLLQASRSSSIQVQISSALAMTACLVEPAASAELNKMHGYACYLRTVRQEVGLLREVMISSWLDEQGPSGDGEMTGNLWQALKSRRPDKQTTPSISLHSIRPKPHPRILHATDPREQHVTLVRSQLNVLAAFMEAPEHAGKMLNVGFTKVLTDLLAVLTTPIMHHLRPDYSLSSKIMKLDLLEKTTISVLRCLTKINSSSTTETYIDVSEHLVRLLSLWRSPVLEACLETIISLTPNHVALQQLLNKQVFRVVFSLTFHKEPTTQALALKAASKMIKYSPKKAPILRPIACSLVRLITLIGRITKKLGAGCRPRQREDLESVLEWAFAFIAELGCMTFYRTLMIDLGVNDLLLNYLCEARSAECKTALAQALQHTAAGAEPNEMFISERQLATLFTFLRPLSEDLQRAAGQVISALWGLPEPYKRLKQLGMTKLLIQMLGSGIRELQLPAAVTICRMKLKFDDNDHTIPNGTRNLQNK